MDKLKTIAIYESDWKELEQMLSGRETFRELIHRILIKLKGGKD